MHSLFADNIWFIATIWMTLAFIASLISIRLAISVALIEILVGVIAGNFLGVHQTTPWIDFLAMMGSGVITFLAGAEIDPASLKENWKLSLLIGFISFAAPFIGVWLFMQYIIGWPLQQALIAGIALSTTSVAVVYSVMVEQGHGETPLGKMILTACFITDFGTVLALGILFANFNIWLIVFIAVLSIILWFLPKLLEKLFAGLTKKKISEPELKFIFLILFFLAGLATTAKSEAVLPAYLVGLITAGVFLRDKTIVNKLRTIAFTILTPFYFLKAGIYVSLPVIWASIGIISVLLAIKVGTKFFIWPFARYHRTRAKEANYITLLMATGLTFGTISALFGLNNHIIDQTQYTILVSVVILSAVVPTMVAQQFFQPRHSTMHAWGRLRRMDKKKRINKRKVAADS